MNRRHIIVGFIAVVLVSFLTFALFRCNASDHATPEAADDEILLLIQLDTKEDIGLLLVNYDVNCSKHSGGISNANQSLLKHDELLDFRLDKQYFDDPSDTVNLSIQFTVVTEYVKPNFEDIYPEEYKKPMDAISFKANYGESYFFTISGDKTNGYKAVLEP